MNLLSYQTNIFLAADPNECPVCPVMANGTIDWEPLIATENPGGDGTCSSGTVTTEGDYPLVRCCCDTRATSNDAIAIYGHYLPPFLFAATAEATSETIF